MKGKTGLKLTGILLILAGAAVTCLALLLEAPGMISVGCAVVGMGVGLLVGGMRKSSTPPGDERQVMLREKAGQMTNGLTFLLLAVLTVVLAACRVQVWVTLAVAGIALLQVILMRVLQSLLGKKY